MCIHAYVLMANHVHILTTPSNAESVTRYSFRPFAYYRIVFGTLILLLAVIGVATFKGIRSRAHGMITARSH